MSKTLYKGGKSDFTQFFSLNIWKQYYKKMNTTQEALKKHSVNLWQKLLSVFQYWQTSQSCSQFCLFWTPKKKKKILSPRWNEDNHISRHIRIQCSKLLQKLCFVDFAGYTIDISLIKGEYRSYLTFSRRAKNVYFRTRKR